MELSVRDHLACYGTLPNLVAVRDAIERGEIDGPRVKAAGNIVGWGGPCSVSCSMVRPQTCDEDAVAFSTFIAQGAGKALMTLTPDELRAAIGA